MGYAPGSETFTDMCDSFIGKIVDSLSYFLLNESLNEHFSGGIVGKREVDLLIEQFLAVFHGGIERFMTAGDHCDPISFGPQLVTFHVRDDLLHTRGHRIGVFFLALDARKDLLEVVDHDDGGLVLLGTNDHRPEQFEQLGFFTVALLDAIWREIEEDGVGFLLEGPDAHGLAGTHRPIEHEPRPLLKFLLGMRTAERNADILSHHILHLKNRRVRQFVRILFNQMGHGVVLSDDLVEFGRGQYLGDVAFVELLKKIAGIALA